MDNLIEYRVVGKSMLKELTDLFVETFNAEPWYDNWTKKTAEKRLTAVLNAEDFYGLAAYQDDLMCGFILGWFELYCDSKEYTIKEFAVRNTDRGQGIGTKLYTEFEKRVEKQGACGITLLTLKGDLTEHFYQKNGFQVEEEIIFMKKKILCDTCHSSANEKLF